MRDLSEIAQQIKREWLNVSVHAEPYLEAMSNLEKMDDKYGVETGNSIVLYFLSNAQNWHGDVARRVKAELKTMLKK